MTDTVINFADLTPDEQQAFCNFQLKEKYRHLSDIDKIDKDLEAIERLYRIKPRHVFVEKWIEI